MFENRVLRKYFGLRGRKRRENGEDCMLRSFVIVFFPKHYLGDHVEEEEMGG
jgi:hypothetical protein